MAVLKKNSVLVVVNDISMPGGLAKAAILLASEVDATVLSLVKPRDVFFNTEHLKIESICLPKLHVLSKFSRLFWYAKCFIRLAYYLKKSEYKNIVGIGGVLSIMLGFMKIKGKNVIGTEHTSFASQGVIRKVIKKISYKGLNSLVVLTDRDKEKFSSYSKNICAIPNFIQSDQKFISRDFSSNILFVGRLNETKGYDYLVEIMGKVMRNNSESKLCVIGEGEEAVLEKDFSGFLDRVTYIASTKEMEKIYKSSSILISCSRSECFPMIFLEAKAFSLPIVAFDCETGPKELIVNGDDGFVVPLGDTDGFAKVLIYLMEDREVYDQMSYHSYLSVKKFGVERFQRQWHELLSMLN